MLTRSALLIIGCALAILSFRPPAHMLVWSDEFNSTAIDTANWNFEHGGNGWGNQEQEYYQRENASLRNGCLVITARKETKEGRHYTSARMTTKGKREFLYGKIEARIKIPIARGYWPAFWMLGANIDSVGWPVCGEADIMEHVNTDSLLYGTLHWNNNGHVQNGDTLQFSPSGFHLYGVEWNANSIRWFVDGKQYHEVNIKNSTQSMEAFHKRFFILLNLALGGNWPGQVIDDGRLPAEMLVDFVRVYQEH